MNSFMSLNYRAQIYWALIVVLGAVAAVAAIAATPGGHAVQLGIWIVFAVAVAGVKIQLPGVPGSLSMNYVIILAALLSMGAGAGMIVALISTVGQCVVHTPSRPRWFQVLFSVAGVPLPVLAANLALHSSHLVTAGNLGSIAVLGASIAYFLINTVSVAGIISLTAQRSLFEI